jgi:hypothetical protein
MDLINGKVAAIKGDYVIVINKGYDDGVEEDMRFIVFEEGEEITDPDTNEPLGKLEYIKAKVIVKYPSKKFSWAETYETQAVPGMSSVVAAVAAMSSIGTRYERVKLPLGTNYELTQHIPDISTVSPFVKIGDLVRQIVE